MFQPISLRLPPNMNAEIEEILEERSYEGLEKAVLLRELLALGIAQYRKSR